MEHPSVMAFTILIDPLFRYDASDAAAGVCHVPFITGNQMNMNVENRLPGSFADIHADIVSIGRVRFIDDALALL